MKHRKLVADIESKATSMGLYFKPSKCRSLSLVSGKPTNIAFYLSTQTPINSVITHPHKFLGSSITPTCSPSDNFSHLREKLEEKLMNVDKAKCRGEFKLAVYERYALPSLRYHLSVHSLHKTHLDFFSIVYLT